MNQKTEDTRATDYVLGELRGERLAEFERQLHQSESLRAEVDAIGETLSAVKLEFNSEASCVNATDLSRIQIAIQSTNSTLASTDTKRSKSKWIVALVSAACLLVIGALAFPGVQQARRVSNLQDGDSFESVLEMDKSEMGDEEMSAESSDGGGGYGGPSKKRNFRSESEQTPNFRYLKAAPTTVPSTSRTQVEREKISGSESLDEPRLNSRATARSDYRADGIVASDQSKGKQDLNFGFDGNSKGPSRISSVRQDSSRRDLSESYSRGMEASDKSLYDDYDSSVESMKADDSMVIDSGLLGSDDSSGVISGGARVNDGFGALPEDPNVEAAIKLRTDLASSLGESNPMVRGLDREIVKTVIPRETRLNDAEEDISKPSRMRSQKSGDQFALINDNSFLDVESNPLSTFSIDVDTASYSKIRMYLTQQNTLPRPDAVRIEELINYFDYDYSPPTDEHPFATAMDVATCPWNPKHRLARIGIKGKMIEEDRPNSNLVFLLDVSGSMNQSNKLPLVINGMKMLTDQLTENDSVAIVVYAGAAGMVLDSTSGHKRQQIHGALDRLRAGGSTNGGQGIQLAYQIARDHFIVGGTNRVILCSDGDFNVGVTGTDELVRIAKQNAKSNIFLTVLGLGTGNHNDAMMEQISNQGNGNYAFIDTKAEARKVLVDQIGGTLVTIAKDVKIQVEFNPQEVQAYRLIGYENRILAAEDFNDDKKDAGEIGAGHTVTALYELVPATGRGDATRPPIDELRYQKRNNLRKDAVSGELLTLKLRYKPPTESISKLISFSVKDDKKLFAQADDDFQFASSVAAFGMLLRQSPHRGTATFASVLEIAKSALGKDIAGYRSEFVEMVEIAKAIRDE